MTTLFELCRYQTLGGDIPFSAWLNGLDDAVFGRVTAYVDRMRHGHFGNSRSIGQGVLELKIDFGPGYRVYYLRDGLKVVILLCGGTKRSQAADIPQARKYAADYRRRL